MQINIDTHFVIGHSHLVNEDYAIGGVEPSPWMVVADGCSSSPQTDIGSRLLAMAAREYLIGHLAAGTEPEANELAQYAALKAEAASRVIGLPLQSIDATLVVAFVTGAGDSQTVKVIAIGDGAIVYTDRQGEMKLIEIEYSHNAPYYPSYRVDRARDGLYVEQSANAVKTVTMNGAAEEEGVREPTVISIPVDGLSSLLIASDGLASFVNVATKQVVPIEGIARSLVAFRNTTGEFLKRKMRRALKGWSKDDVFNSDDLSVAAMVFDKGGDTWTSSTVAANESA